MKVDFSKLIEFFGNLNNKVRVVIVYGCWVGVWCWSGREGLMWGARMCRGWGVRASWELGCWEIGLWLLWKEMWTCCDFVVCKWLLLYRFVRINVDLICFVCFVSSGGELLRIELFVLLCCLLGRFVGYWWSESNFCNVDRNVLLGWLFCESMVFPFLFFNRGRCELVLMFVEKSFCWYIRCGGGLW